MTKFTDLSHCEIQRMLKDSIVYAFENDELSSFNVENVPEIINMFGEITHEPSGVKIFTLTFKGVPK